MAADIFAKIGDIKGESNDAKHKDEIEVLSWSWGVSQSGTMAHGGGGGAGKASFQDFNFMHNIDKASPVLLQAARPVSTSRKRPSRCAKPARAPQEFLVIKLTDILISSVSSSGSRRVVPRPRASRSITRRSMLEYKPQKADGSWMPA